MTYMIYFVLYYIFCKEGGTWEAIPHDYPNWQNVR